MTFGERLKQSRNRKQLTQSQVADRLGVDFTTISKYENDKSQPDNQTLRELASVYEVSLDWLLSGEKVTEPAALNRIVVNGEQELLTEEEARHLLDSLEMYRLLKAKRRREDLNDKKRS